MTFLQLALGLALLIASGEFLVRGAVGLARAFGVSPLFIGITLVGFGTSTPELVASLVAAFRGSPGIAVGNVVGSNIANVLLILGIVALIAPVPVVKQAFHRDAVALVGASAVAVLMALIGNLSRLAGGFLIMLLLAYIYLTYRTELASAGAEADRHEAEAGLHAPPRDGAWRQLLVAVAALAGVILGARLLVDGSLLLAREYRVPETVVGLTIVAVGTSLPELAVSTIAAYRGQGAVAVGNIVGSNIYNVLGILGITAAVHPLEVPLPIARFDVWVMLAVALWLIYFMVKGRALGRVAGAGLLAAYAAYLAALAW